MIEQGEAICTKAKEEQIAGLKQLTAKANKGSQQAYVEEVIVEVVLPPIQTAAGQLAAAGGPDDIVSGLEKAVSEAEANPRSVVTGSKESPFKEIDRLEAEYGLKVCAGLA